MSNDFIRLAAFEREQIQPKTVKGNIVKKELVVYEGKSKIYLENDDNEPTIVVHRAGDIVEGVEFKCTCGKTALVNIQYEDESNSENQSDES